MNFNELITSDISEVMSQNVATVKDDLTVLDVVRHMASLDIGSVLIVDGDNNLVGIFSERDVLNKIAAQELDPSKTMIADVMTKEPCTLTSNTMLSKAFQLMHDNNFRHVPVVDNGQLVGLLSIRDITHLLHQQMTNILFPQE